MRGLSKGSDKWNMKKKLGQSTVLLMVIIIFSKLLGMLREVVLAKYFGTSNISDAYLIAISIPTLLFYFIGHALNTAYLPMFNKVRATRGESEAVAYSNNILCCAGALSLILIGALILFPQVIIKIFAAGFDDETVRITSKLIRIGAFSLLFMTAINIFSGYLQAHGNFIVPGMISIPRNVILIVSIVVASVFGVQFLGIGILVAYIAECFILIPFTVKKGYRVSLGLDLSNPDMLETAYVILPIIIGVGVGQINKIIDRSLASMVISGGISALSYASIINNAVQEVLVTGIITILFAKCAAWVAEGKHDIVKSKLNETIETFVFILIPSSFGVITLSELLVKTVLCRGQFDAESVRMTSGALCFYTCGLTFLAIRDTLVKVFYAYKETKITTISSTIAILVNLVLNIILSRWIGINGLAIATSIASALNCCILYVVLKKKIGDFGIKHHAVALLKAVLGSAAMVIAIRIFLIKIVELGFSEVTQLFLSVIIGGLVYFVTSILLGSKTALSWMKILWSIKTKLGGK